MPHITGINLRALRTRADAVNTTVSDLSPAVTKLIVGADGVWASAPSADTEHHGSSADEVTALPPVKQPGSVDEQASRCKRVAESGEFFSLIYKSITGSARNAQQRHRAQHLVSLTASVSKLPLHSSHGEPVPLHCCQDGRL